MIREATGGGGASSTVRPSKLEAVAHGCVGTSYAGQAGDHDELGGLGGRTNDVRLGAGQVLGEVDHDGPGDGMLVEGCHGFLKEVDLVVPVVGELGGDLAMEAYDVAGEAVGGPPQQRARRG